MQLTSPTRPNTSLPALDPRQQLVVRLDARADLSAVEAMPRGPERRAAAFAELRATAATTQREALAALEPLRQSGAVTHVESMFLPNALIVTAANTSGQQAVRDALAGVARIGEVRANKRFAIPAASTVQSIEPPHSWAMDAIRAPEAWQQGARGAGVTIGIVDSGANVTHPALHAAYRGHHAADGATRSHDYAWFDGIEHGSAPVDPGGHGTQVASVAVGAKIGVAPDARFIAARVIEHGYNSTVATLQGLQWMLAPTRIDGTDPRPDLGADIVNNSWGTSNGRDEFFRESFEGLRAAGIELVTATGNSGEQPGNVSAPASYPGFVSVGATDRTGQVADFSSRGPTPLPNPDGARTPIVTAPGLMVPTAKGDRYVYSSGTSIAAPIVAGSLAVLLSADPDATSEQLRTALTSTAVDIAAPGVDDASGHGRIDLAAALATMRPAPTHAFGVAG